MNREEIKQDILQEGKTVREIILTLKRSLWLMIAIMVVAIASGVVFSYFQTPSFTANRKISFVCENINYTGSDGKQYIINTTQNNFSTMVAYADTIIDFVDEGNVVDRANSYYVNYLNGNYESVEDYIAYLENSDSGVVVDHEGYIYANSISIKKFENEQELPVFTMQIKYTDVDSKEASDKLAILVYAFKKECSATINNQAGHSIYFKQFHVFVKDLGSLGVSDNNSTFKNLIIFGLLGAFTAIVVIYVKTLINNTITTKEELERYVGAPVFAAIENRG